MGVSVPLPEQLDEAVVMRHRTMWSFGSSGPDFDLDRLVVEEPLEIRLGNTPLAVVMRTPGQDVDLATGFALTELIVESSDDLLRVLPCDLEGGENVVRILTKPHAMPDPAQFQRNLYSTSSCGICGKKSIAQAMKTSPKIESAARFNLEILAQIPEALSAHQPIFSVTGALHAAALCDASGTPLFVREDIGRHNAVDKVVGAAARAGQTTEGTILAVSGRASFEVVQKALAARIPAVVAVGGVSSLAAQLAESAEMLLVGFARGERFSVYAGVGRTS